jgi:histidinol phosphatase-like enzyme
VVGDKMTDIGLAGSVGARGILVRTGHGEHELARQGGTVPAAAFIATDLMEATSWMLGQAGAARLAG